MRGKRIAVVEDDPAQSELVGHVVESMQAVVELFTNGEGLLKSLQRESYDMLIVDWELPGIQGPDIVKAVRRELGSDVPILFITNRSMEVDIVSGLEAGADDYMVKPVRPNELQARIRALMRRAYPLKKAESQVFGKYVFDLQQKVVHLNGLAVTLQPKEFDLAICLFLNEGRLMSRTHLIQAVWHASADTESRSLETHVSRVRTKLQIAPENGYRISSVYGHGYRLDAVASAK